MPDSIGDYDGAFQRAQTALACICTELEVVRSIDAAFGGCPCRSFVLVGGVVADWESCCGCDDLDDDRTCHECDGDDLLNPEGGPGQLVVEVGNVTQAGRFPSPAAESLRCPSEFQASFTATLLRCVPVMQADGSAPRPVVQESTSRGFIVDAAAIRRALQCCSQPDECAGEIGAVTQTFLPWQGGCGGVTTTWTQRIPDCGCD